MRKTWIKVKRGLLDPKHVQQLGVRFAFYLLMIDWANWECGSILYYRDKDAADALEMPIRTIREWRRKLQEDGYIECEQKKDHQKIKILKWTNPREYSGKLYNDPATAPEQPEIPYTPSKGYENVEPFSDKGDNEGYIKGYIKGDMKGSRKHVTPSSNSQITNHKSQIIEEEKKINDLFDLMHRTIFAGTLNDVVWDMMKKAPKKMDGKLLRITVKNQEMADMVNGKMERAKKNIAACRFPFAAFVLEVPEEKENNDGKDM